MNKGNLIILSIILFTIVVSASTYNFISNSNINLFNITSEGNVYSKGNITSGDWFFGNLAWSNLTSYPVGCPADTYITLLGDSITCSSVTYNYNQTAPAQTYADNNFLKLTGGQLTGNVNYSNANQTMKNSTYTFYGSENQASIRWDSVNNRLEIKVS